MCVNSLLCGLAKLGNVRHYSVTNKVLNGPTQKHLSKHQVKNTQVRVGGYSDFQTKPEASKTVNTNTH